MPWQITILLYSLLGATRNVISRQIGIEKRDFSLNALLYSFSAVFTVGILYVTIAGKPINSQAAWDARYYLIIGGSLFAGLNLLYLKLFRRVSASVGVLLILLSPLSVVIVSTLLTDETLTVTQVFGSVFILCAVLLAELSNKKPKKIGKRMLVSTSLLLSIIIAIMAGFATVNEKYLLDRLGLDTYLVYGWGMQLLATIIIVFVFRKSYKKVTSNKLRFYLLTHALLLAFSGFFFIQTLIRSDNAALTSITASFKTVLAVAMAIVILKERQKIKIKVVSVLISVIGLLLLFQ